LYAPSGINRTTSNLYRSKLSSLTAPYLTKGRLAFHSDSALWAGNVSPQELRVSLSFNSPTASWEVHRMRAGQRCGWFQRRNCDEGTRGPSPARLHVSTPGLRGSRTLAGSSGSSELQLLALVRNPLSTSDKANPITGQPPTISLASLTAKTQTSAISAIATVGGDQRQARLYD
jgi:hypothetical protein